MTALPRSMKPDPDRNARTAVSRAGRRKEQEVVNPFAFYGRVSTEDQQDPASSRAWQLRRALELQALEQRVLDLRLRGLGHSLLSRWPPKALRIADRTRLPQSASPREAKRLKSDAASTGAGTPSSTAACTVQRPSPESLTRPA